MKCKMKIKNGKGRYQELGLSVSIVSTEIKFSTYWFPCSGLNPLFPYFQHFNKNFVIFTITGTGIRSQRNRL